MTDTKLEPYVDAKEVARLLGVAPKWVLERAVAGDNPIPSYKIGGHRRFRLTEIERWASGQKTGGDE